MFLSAIFLLFLCGLFFAGCGFFLKLSTGTQKQRGLHVVANRAVRIYIRSCSSDFLAVRVTGFFRNCLITIPGSSTGIAVNIRLRRPVSDPFQPVVFQPPRQEQGHVFDEDVGNFQPEPLEAG